jgi:hypothetical protein
MDTPQYWRRTPRVNDDLAEGRRWFRFRKELEAGEAHEGRPDDASPPLASRFFEQGR